MAALAGISRNDALIMQQNAAHMSSSTSSSTSSSHDRTVDITANTVTSLVLPMMAVSRPEPKYGDTGESLYPLKLICDYLDEEMRMQIFKKYPGVMMRRYPFINFDCQDQIFLSCRTVEEMDDLYRQLGSRIDYFSERVQYPELLEIPSDYLKSLPYAALQAFEYDLLEHILKINRHQLTGISSLELWKQSAVMGNYPHISLTIAKKQLEECIARTRPELPEISEQLKETLVLACRKASPEIFKWGLEKSKELSLTFPTEFWMQIAKEALMSKAGNNLQILREAGYFTNWSPRQTSEIVNFAISCGSIDVLPLLGFSLLDEQVEAMAKAQKILSTVQEREDLLPPLPINPDHINVHGGDKNWELYKYLYREGVGRLLCYLVYYDAPDFEQWIELSGRIRHRQALLTWQRNADTFGNPVNLRFCRTVYKTGTYSQYGRKIHAMYDPALLEEGLSAFTMIDNRRYALSTLYLDRWEHPTGKDRAVIVRKLARLADIAYFNFYSDDQEGTKALMQVLGNFYWHMASFPLFDRGNPTALAMVVDALLLHRKRTALVKTSGDINCEALCYTVCDRFMQEIMAPLPLPQVVGASVFNTS